MPVSGYLIEEFSDEELSIILAIHNDFTDNSYMDVNTIKSMKFDWFIRKLIESKDRANNEGINKINIILNKIDVYINSK